MQTAKRRRTTWAIAASALAHVAVLILALLQRPTLPSPSDEETGPPEAIIPILLLPRTPPLAAAGAPQPSSVRLHRRPQRTDESSPPVAPLPVPTGPQRPPESVQPPTITARAPPAAAGASAPDLRLALRHGLVGCANAGAVDMTRAEREHCEEQLAHGVAQAPVMPIAIAPRIRSYYDAVAEAKKPDRQPMPLRAPGRLGILDSDDRGTTGHPPLVGCSIPFGPGEKPKLPSHWLKLGPCFIAPPKGSLTTEADITPP